MPKSVIIPAGSSAPLAPFVPGTLADGVVYVSGTLAFVQHNNVLFADAQRRKPATFWKPSARSSRRRVAQWRM